MFAKNILGDCLFVPALAGFEFALYDIDHNRLKESETMLRHLKANYGANVTIQSYHNRKEALKDAKYVINAIQVGGYRPSTVIDFEIPKKYGLKDKRLRIRFGSAASYAAFERMLSCWN
ncbi:hypothetical protein BSAF29S_00247 [Bacillus safensis subsp. safensis]